MKFPKHIELQMKLPRYKRSQDLIELLDVIDSLQKALVSWKPEIFDELQLLDTFVQIFLTRNRSVDRHDLSLRYAPHLNAENRQRAESVYQLLCEHGHGKSSQGVIPGDEQLVVLQDSPVTDIGSLDEQSDALFFDSEQKSHVMECQLLGNEISQFLDVEYPHELYTSFQHISHIRSRQGIYQNLGSAELFRLAQLILVNILSRDEVCFKALSSDAQRFFCQRHQLTRAPGCSSGLWEFALLQRRSENRRHTILLCSLLSPNEPRPVMSFILDARRAINAKHSAQWTPPLAHC